MDVFGMDFVVVMIAVAVISAIGSAVWWVLIIWLGVKAVNRAGRQVDADLAALERMIRQIPRAPAGGVTLRPDLATALARAQGHLMQLRGLERARYDLRVAELQSMAASAGIDVRL